MTDTFDPLAPFRMDSQVVVLTGASSGLGERFARILDALGATTVLVAPFALARAAYPGMRAAGAGTS